MTSDNNLRRLQHQQGMSEDAKRVLRAAIEQDPDKVEAYNALAQLLFTQDDEIGALSLLGDALRREPANVQTLLLTATIQLKRGNLRAAEHAARLALEDGPDNPTALAMLGEALQETDCDSEMLELLDRAVNRNPRSAEIRNLYGATLKSAGRVDEARHQILRAIELDESMYGAYANLSDLMDFTDETGDELFKRMEAILEAAPDREAPRFIALHFAYAKAFDDRGHHEEALNHYVIGGRVKRAQLRYDESEMFGFFDAIRTAFPRTLFENRTYRGVDDDRPVFIVGMPRSGSTLIEQILSSHTAISGAGEVKHFPRAVSGLLDRCPALPDYPAMVDKLGPPQLKALADDYRRALARGANNAKRITDKLLTNYFFLGLINLALPKAKVIHTRRDPADTCLSVFTKLFKDGMAHSYDLGELGRYYCKYRELMDHWETVLPEGSMITVNYEDVVADSEKQARRVIAFLGLSWDQKCVEFHESDRPVKTASAVQVRKPIYATAVRRWTNYGPGIQPLLDALRRHVPLG